MIDQTELGPLRPELVWHEAGPLPLPPQRLPATPMKPLRRALKASKRPVILVNDTARTHLRGLPDVVGELWALAGEPPLVAATGTHKPSLALMRDLMGGLPVELHDADAADEHVGLSGARSSPRIDRRVAEADLVLAFGSVEPHYFAGWTGAHKTATIGVLARETIAKNHENALSQDARPLALTGNPVYEGLVAILKQLEQGRRLLCVNHVLDASGQPLGVGVGTWRGSLQRAVRTAARHCVPQVEGPYDVVLAEVEGPLGRSLYQADKGIKNTESVVRDGGHVILHAKLDRGLGADRFVRLLREAPDLASALAQVERDGYTLGDHKAVRLRALQDRGVAIHVVSAELDPSELEGCGLWHHANLQDALEATGATGKALLVHDAGLCVPSSSPTP